MPVINPFANLDLGFSLVEMTAAIDNLPPRPSRISQLGLFSDVPLTTPQALIELREHALVLIPTTQWGTPRPTGSPLARKVKSVVVPHTTWGDAVLASDVMGVRKFGSDSVFETIQERVLAKLQEARDSFDATDEFRQLNALKGIVVDADGTSELFNSYTEFGVTQKTINFKFSDPTTDVHNVVRSIKRYVEHNLFGETVTGYRVFVGAGFYDKLVQHPSVKEALLGWQAAAVLNRDSRSAGFEIEGVVFEEYTGRVSNPDGSAVVNFLGENAGVVIPLGTRNTFKRFLAPAMRVDTVNTLGKPYYAWQTPRADGSGIDMVVESNTLPVCLRPQLLVQLGVN